MGSGVDIAQRGSGLCGRAVRVACKRHETAHGLGNDAKGRFLRIEPVLAKAADTAQDDARVDLLQNGVVDPQALHHARCIVLENNI